MQNFGTFKRGKWCKCVNFLTTLKKFNPQTYQYISVPSSSSVNSTHSRRKLRHWLRRTSLLDDTLQLWSSVSRGRLDRFSDLRVLTIRSWHINCTSGAGTSGAGNFAHCARKESDLIECDWMIQTGKLLFESGGPCISRRNAFTFFVSSAHALDCSWSFSILFLLHCLHLRISLV